MDKIVTFFQVCHSTDQPLCKERQQEFAAKKELKEANQERNADNKKHAAVHRKTSLSTENKKSEKRGCTENLCCYCKLDGYDVTWNSCSHHNFWHPNYHQPSGLLTNHSQDKSCRDRDEHCNTCNHHCSQSHSCDWYDHRDRNCKPATCDCKGQSYHAKHCDRSRSRSQSQSRSHSCDSWTSRHDHGH